MIYLFRQSYVQYLPTMILNGYDSLKAQNDSIM